MHASTRIHVPDAMTDKVSDAVSASREFVQDVAHNVAERAPDLSSAVSRGARSSMGTVTDVVAELPGQVTKIATKLAALTPFVEAPPPARHRARWLLRAAVVASIVGIGWWLVNRSQHSDDTTHIAGGATTKPTDRTDSRLATAGR